MKRFVFPTSNGVVVQSGQKKVAAFVDCGGQKVLRTFEDKNKIIFWHFPFVRGIQRFFCGLFAMFSAFLLADDVCGQKNANTSAKINSATKINAGKTNINNTNSANNTNRTNKINTANKTNGAKKTNETKTNSKLDTIKFKATKSNKIKSIQTQINKSLIIFVLVLVSAGVFGAIWLGWLPGKIAWLCVGASGNAFLRNLLLLGLKIAFFYVFLLFFRVFPQINEFFRFNRAADIAQICGDFSKFKRKKCPTNPQNFLNFVVFVFVLDTTVLTLIGASFGFLFNLLFHAAIFLACIGVADELLRLLERFPKMWNLAFCTAILVCEKPSTTHLETASIALTEAGLLENQKEREFMDADKIAFSVAYNEVKNKLLAAGIADKSDVDWLFATVLGKNRAEIKLVATLSEKQYQDVLRAANRRAKGESLDNIFGFTEFFGLRFDVNKKVLTPRMETEILVENVIKTAKNALDLGQFSKTNSKNGGKGRKISNKIAGENEDETDGKNGNKEKGDRLQGKSGERKLKIFESKKNAAFQILDVGTGSGAIAVAVAKNLPDAQVVAVDISPAALAVAQNNARKNNVKVEFLQSNLFDGLKKKQKFDIIVSNPPYIKTDDIKKLDKVVRECDPILALDGGEDGLDFYRKIVAAAPKRLKSGGQIFFEVGKGQAPAVRKILREFDFVEIKTIKDYNNIERIVTAKFSK